MLGTAVAQLRFAIALLNGRPVPPWALNGLIAGARATLREFGEIGAEGAQAVSSPLLDEASRREVQLRRFRRQAAIAAAETTYYGNLFATLGLDPRRLTWQEIARLPLTPKDALRDDPDAFVRHGADCFLRATTHGTTGTPTAVCFSSAELRAMAALSGLGFLLQDTLAPDDVVMIGTSARGLLGNIGLAGGAAHAGAMVIPSGVIDPAHALAQLAAPLRVPGKKPKVSTLAAYPSYVGMLVEEGLRRGYGPHDFGLERILGGGEIVTQGLKERARRLFGDARWSESWAMTETYPVGGTRCEEGHLHFPLDQGLVEVLDPDSGETAEPGALGVLVVTPFAPFRDATPLLRYNTEDLVRAVPAALTCSLKSLPATSDLLGKQRLSVRVDGQWVTPRQVLEALETLECVPLPARCGFRAAPAGIDVEVVVREEGAQVRHAIIAALETRDVPVRDVRLVIDPSQLEDPYPLRGDLRETHFTATSSLQSLAPGRAV
jgi:phenylacetate-coenzyme A ligase PaaK-like adenylate-forming protein